MATVRTVIKGDRVKEYRLFDPETGEVLDQVVKLLAYIPKNVEREPFDKVFKTMWVDLLNNPKLKGAPLRVLVWLMSKNSWGNEWIGVDYDELAQELKYSPETVRHAFRVLKEANLIIQKAPRKTWFRLNPKYVFMGLAIQRREDIDF